MKNSAGWWITDGMSGSAAINKRSMSLARPVALCKSKRTCIQAGGNIGVFPAILAPDFARVITFEPEAENFACLVKNTESYSNVYQIRGFLSDSIGSRELLRGKYSGGHHIGHAGETPTFTIDALRLHAVDAIFLDVEGHEYAVLQGALNTIQRCKPLLMLEENKKLYGYGREFGQLLDLVAPLGYMLTYKADEDIILEAAK